MATSTVRSWPTAEVGIPAASDRRLFGLIAGNRSVKFRFLEDASRLAAINYSVSLDCSPRDGHPVALSCLGRALPLDPLALQTKGLTLK